MFYKFKMGSRWFKMWVQDVTLGRVRGSRWFKIK